MTCKECVHYEVCVYLGNILDVSICDDFKPKSRFVELPCEVGQTVWRVVTMGTGVKFKKVGYNTWREREQTIKHFIRSVTVTKNNFYDIVFGGDFGKTVFLSREEAERELQKRGENNA